MTKRRSESVGLIVCPWCLSAAEVAQTPGKLYRYIYCTAPGCKPSHNYGQAYQDYIADHMRETIETTAQDTAEGREFAPPGPPAAVAVEDAAAVAVEVDDTGGIIWPWE